VPKKLGKICGFMQYWAKKICGLMQYLTKKICGLMQKKYLCGEKPNS
jgi:hypothetical protein